MIEALCQKLLEEIEKPEVRNWPNIIGSRKMVEVANAYIKALEDDWQRLDFIESLDCCQWCGDIECNGVCMNDI